MKITKNINSKSQKTKKNKTKVIVDILFSNWTKKLRNMKYMVNVIETENTGEKLDNVMYLVQKEYTLADLEQEVAGTVQSGIVKNVV